MKFKIDNNFKRICGLHPEFPEIKPAMTISEELCAAFVNAGIIGDKEDNYGLPFIQVAGNAMMFDILDVLTKYFGIESIYPEIWDALCTCTLMGDGDCPYCGGNLEFVETEGHRLNDGDRWVDDSYIIDNYIYRCAVCGETVKTPNEL